MLNQDILARHIDRASEPMIWGCDDCCQFVRAIVLDCGGPDIMAGIPAYECEKVAKRMIKKKGGMVRMVMKQAKAIGARELTFPFASDGLVVGLVATPQGPALSIRVNNRWTVRAHNGVCIYEPHAAVMAWEIANA
jgi:hypothetical protein